MPIFTSIRSGLETILQKHYVRDAVLPLDRETVRIIVGAGEDSYEGWVATDSHTLDVARGADWAVHFKPNMVDAILAEHVWEHLEPPAAIRAAQNCFRYLTPGGYIRVAVPDGLHPDRQYINQVKPGGWGAGSHDHRVLYTYQSLSAVFASLGFEITMLEYFDEGGTFHYREWSPADGLITRSKRYDNRNRIRELAYTSIILDARKPVAG